MSFIPNNTGTKAVAPDGVQLANGSISAPGLSFSDSLTGLYRPGANVLGFTVNGTEAGNISATGFTLGAPSLTGTNTIRGNVAMSGDTFTVNNATTSPTIEVITTSSSTTAQLKAKSSGSSGVSPAMLTLEGNSNSANYINSAGSRPLQFIENGVTGTILGSMAGGAWTLGPSGYTGTQTIRGVLYVDRPLAGGSGESFLLARDTTSGRSSVLSVYKHPGISNPASYLGLYQENGQFDFYWSDNNNDFRYSASAGHVGTTSGTVIGTQTSDSRLKRDVVPIGYGLISVMNL